MRERLCCFSKCSLTVSESLLKYVLSFSLFIYLRVCSVFRVGLWLFFMSGFIRWSLTRGQWSQREVTLCSVHSDRSSD